MLSFSGSRKIFVLVEPCDMRNGFNGLYGMVSTTFGEDPRSGALFVFSNRWHTRIKILYFDGSPGPVDRTAAPRKKERIESIAPLLRTAWHHHSANGPAGQAQGCSSTKTPMAKPCSCCAGTPILANF
jgi:hypothetical protein